MLGLEIRPGIHAFGERIGIQVDDVTAGLEDALQIHALLPGLFAEPEDLAGLKAQGMVELLQAAVTAEGDDGVGFAVQLQNIAAMDRVQVTADGGQAVELTEPLIDAPVFAVLQKLELLERHWMEGITGLEPVAHGLLLALRFERHAAAAGHRRRHGFGLRGELLIEDGLQVVRQGLAGQQEGLDRLEDVGDDHVEQHPCG